MTKHINGWRTWPIIATLLALTFVIWDVSLVSRARRSQARIGEQVRLLDQLTSVKGSLDKLVLIQRAEAPASLSEWTSELDNTRARLGELTLQQGPVDGIDGLPPLVHLHLDHADSLNTIARRSNMEAARMERAIAQVILQQARSEVDRTMRAIHEGGLDTDIAQLNDEWSEAQTLLFTACLLAVIMAFLVGSNRKLLHRSQRNARALEQAHADLERTHKDLRETMLSKEEKEVMIKEIHHRVKNNLQIVRSLIRFQTDKVTDPRMLELFNECINRVGAMALVHEQTYLTKDLANIEVSGYMNSLVRDLIAAYNIRLDLRMDIDIQVRTLGVDTLIPLGLLINEVISNSFKHAFKGRTQGRIIVHLHGSEGALDLRIGDDGVGLPDRAHWDRPQSLGMELIQTLAGQLDSTVELLPGEGTVFAMRSIPVRAQKRA